jgi:hypothetical protein
VSLENTELKIGKTSFKGVWIAIVLGIGSTIGGGVWTASSLYSRLEAVEAKKIPSVAPIEKKIELIEQELTANDVSKLQGKLAELGTSLIVLKDQQTDLLKISDRVNGLDKEIESIKSSVKKSEIIAENIGDVSEKLDTTKREISDIWDALDFLSNPLQ